MRKTIAYFAVLGTLLLASQFAFAQSDSKEYKDGEKNENLGERIGKKVERFVARLTSELSHGDESDPFDPDTLPGVSRKHEVDLDLENERKTDTHEGDFTVEADRTIKSNIVVKGGNLTVFGTIDGDVLVVGGTLYLKGGGRITGNARVINGDVVREKGGIVEGYTDKTSSRTVGYREERDRFTRSSHTFRAPWISENANLDNFVFRYNRVEGLFLGLGSEKKYNWDGRRDFSSYGSIGWGIRSHTWRGNLGIARQFPIDDTDNDQLFEIGVEGYSLTDTKDRWLIDVHENTVAALLIHEDFRDYYQRNGYSAHVAYYLQNEHVKMEMKAAYRADEYASLKNNTEWALFGGDKLFRPNPAIDNGKMRSVLTSVGISTEHKSARGPEGWSIFGSFEYGPKTLGGVFDFDQYVLDVRRFQPITYYDNFNIRLRAGTSDGRLPIQRAYDLGGLGTLNGYPFKIESGNRLILLNAEYIMNGDALDDLDFWPSWLFRHVNLLFFTDAGLVRTIDQSAGPTEGFDKITWGEFKNDVGVGFSNKSGSFRIGVGWRTDIKAPARLVLRVTRPF